MLFSMILLHSPTGNMQSFLQHDLSYFDLLDPHIWMAQTRDDEFYQMTGYKYERFDRKGYTNLSLKAADVYRARPEYWQRGLVDNIDAFADVSRKIGMPLITTECWGVVDYKDWPLLKWDWVQELCVWERGMRPRPRDGWRLPAATSASRSLWACGGIKRGTSG